MSDTKKLNPEVKTATIGVRVLREISVYPMSVGEQVKLTDVITETMKKFLEEGKEKEVDAEFVEFLVGLIKEKVSEIIMIVTDETDADLILNDMTNDQLVDFAEIVYDMNFGGAKKKFQTLIKKVKGVLT